MVANKEIMAKNIRKYMELHHKTATDICADLGFKQNTFSDWVNAKIYPRIDKIEMMANYFGISKTYLVEDMDSLSEQGAEDAMLISQYHKLTPGNRAVIKSTLAALLAAQDT